MRRPQLLFLILVLLVLPAVAPAQESVLLRVGGQPGQSAKYQTTMEMFIRGGPMAMMGGDSTQPFMRRTAFTTRSVTAVNGDTITMSEVTDSARVETPANPQMAPMMQGAVGPIGQATTSRMSTRGALYSTDRPGAAAAQGGPGGMGPGGPGGMGGGPGMGGRGGRGGMGGMGRNQRTMFMLPANPVRVGDSWTDTMVVVGEQPGEPSTTFAATYRLQRVEQQGARRIAVVSMDGTYTTAGGPGGAQLMNVTGEFQLDTTQRRLNSMAMTMSGTMQSPQGEMPVRMQINQTMMP